MARWVLIFLLLICTSLYAQYPHAIPAFNTSSNNASLADSFQKRGLHLLDTSRRFSNEFERHMHIAKLLYGLSEYEAAIFWYNNALKYALNNDHKIKVYDALASIYDNIGIYDRAMEMNVVVSKLANDSITLGKTKLNIARIYGKVSDYKSALKILDEVTPMFRHYHDTPAVIMGLNAKAQVYQFMKNYDSSLRYHMASYELASQHLSSLKNDTIKFKNIISVQTITLNNIADAYIHKHQPDSALLYLKKTLPAFALLKKNNQAVVYTSFGEVYSLKGQISEALDYFNKALLIAEPAGFYNVKSTAYKALSELYDKQGQYKLAWEFQKKYITLYEEIISKDNIHKINHLQNEYALGKKDKEIAQKELLITQNRLELAKKRSQLYGIILIVGFAFVAIFIFIKNIRNKQRLLTEKIKLAEKEMVLAQAEATLQGEARERERIAQELHDSVVSELMAVKLNIDVLSNDFPDLRHDNNYEAIQYQSTEITEKLRQTAHNLMPVKIHEQGLITAISEFMQRIRNGKVRFGFSHFGTALPLTEQCEKIVFMIVQELAQNIIKHSRATEATIQLNYFEDSISLTVEDNGVGLGHHRLGTTNGMGLPNIKKQVIALNGSIDIQSSEVSGTNVFIEIPI